VDNLLYGGQKTASEIESERRSRRGGEGSGLQQAAQRPHVRLWFFTWLNEIKDLLVRTARRALAKVMAYRQKHAARLAADAALEDIVATLRLCQWPAPQARRIARQLREAGVSPATAVRLFADAEERTQ
jgi:hypothetical protein